MTVPEEGMLAPIATIPRIYADEAGETHFDEFTVSGIDQQSPMSISRAVYSEGWDADRVLLRRVIAEDESGEPHNAAIRQFVIQLVGTAEFEVSDGERRQIAPGEVILLDDLTGWGHITRNVGDEPRVSLFVRLPSDKPFVA